MISLYKATMTLSCLHFAETAFVPFWKPRVDSHYEAVGWRLASTSFLKISGRAVSGRVAWATGLPKGIGEGRFLMEEGGGGEEKGRPDTKSFSKSCDTSRIWMWQWLDNSQYALTSPTASKHEQRVLISCVNFMDRDAERNSKRL